MCEIDPSKIPHHEASNPSAARYGAGRMIFLEEVFHAMVAQEKKEALDDEYEGKTPLRRAIEDVHDDLPFGQAAVCALIDAKADINKNNVFFHTVKNLCALKQKDQTRYQGLFKICKMLVTNKADVNATHDNEAPLSVALTSNNNEVMKLLTEYGALLGRRVLYDVMAARPINKDFAKIILSDIQDKRNKLDERGASIDYEQHNKTPLILGIMAVLESKETDKTKDEDLVLGETGILMAGADTNIGAPFNFCLARMLECMEEGREADYDFLERVAMYLLSQGDADMDSKTDHGFAQAVRAQSYIAFIIIQNRKAQHYDLFKVLKQVAEMDEPGGLKRACSRADGSEEFQDYLNRIVVSLISAGMGIHMVFDNQTALTLAIMTTNFDFISMLIGKNCTIHDGFPFHTALNEIRRAQGDNARIEFLEHTLKTLLEQTTEDNNIINEDKFRNEQGQLCTPLTLAIMNDAQEFTYQLLELDATSKTLCSPLVVALNEVNKLGTDDEDLQDDHTKARLDFLFDVIEKLLADQNLTEGSTTIDTVNGRTTILIMAIDTKKIELVRSILKSDQNDMVNFMRPLAHCLKVFEEKHASSAKRQTMDAMARMLLEYGANPDVRVGDEQEYALTVAARAGKQQLTHDIIQMLPKHNKDSFDEQDRHGRPAIHRFLHWLQECDPHEDEKIKFLEETLVQLVNTVNEDSLNVIINEQSPLDIAFQCGNLQPPRGAEVIKALLSNNANFGASALVDTLKELQEPGLTAERKKFVEDAACTLIKNGADVNLGIGSMHPFNLTFNAGSADVLNAMLEDGEDGQTRLDLHGSDGKPLAQTIAGELAELQAGNDDRKAFLIEAAVALGRKDPSVFHEILDSTKGSSDFSQAVGFEICNELIKSGIAVDAKRESDGATPLHCAASAGAKSILRALLEKDSDVNAVNNFNQTPLIYAAIAGHLDCVRALLAAGPDTSIAGGLYLKDMTALHEAALVGDPEIVRELVEASAPVDATAYWRRTPLHLAVVGGVAGEDRGRHQCVEALIQGGCDVNALDLDSETGLSYAVERDYHDVSDLLLKKGADPCGSDIHGTTPIHHCVENHNIEIFQNLLDNKPDTIEELGLLAPVIRAGFKPGIEPLAQACGKIDKIDALTGMIATANIGGWLAPLWNACYFGQTEIAESFLAQVVDLNLKDHAQFTLLHRLIHWGGRHHTDFITTLLNSGHNLLNIRDRNNRSPLQVAVRLGNEAAALALRQGGAVASEEDVEVAKESGDPALHLMIGGPPNLPSIDDRSSYENATRWCCEHNAKFLDSSFKPCLGSLVDVTDNSKLPGRYHDVEWVRAGEACKGHFSGAFDVTVGPLGDPFFLATLPDDPNSAFPHDAKESEHGLYEVTVQWMGETKTVMVDDFVPAIDGKPISLESASGMMWPLIYEKACAKVAGSYQALAALRHAEKTIIDGHSSLPDRMQASSRRQHEVNNFISPCLSAAMLGGFASNDQALASFACEFGDSTKSESNQMLDDLLRPQSGSQPPSTIGNFDMMQFPIKSPAKVVKVTADTNIRAECSYSASAAGTCTVALCVVEIANDNWRLVKASVSTAGQTSVVVETTLEASGNRYLVFVGTPTNKTGIEHELHLVIDSDLKIQVMDQ